MVSLPPLGAEVNLVLRSTWQTKESLQGAINLADDSEVLVDWPDVLPLQFTVYAAKVVSHVPLLTIRPSQDDILYEHHSSTGSLGKYVVEFCAGSGAMGAAAIFMGGKVLASVDNNAMAANHLERNEHGRVFHANW